MLRAIFGVALLTACYEAPQVCNIHCDDSSGCPSGMTCVDEYCRGDDVMCPAPPVAFTSVSVGANHACGVSTKGLLFCWGSNAFDQLGKVGPDAPAPVLVDQSTWIAVATGALHTCGLHSDGTAWCWGHNTNGQASGSDTMMPIAAPTSVAVKPADMPPPFEKITAGASHTCALGAGQLWCWGNEQFVGANDMMAMTMVHVAPTIGDWRDVSAGWDHTCAIRATGELYCWGGNNSTQVDATALRVKAPVQINVDGRAVIRVAATDEGTCAITGASADATAGRLFCWGINGGHEIDDTGQRVSTPKQMGTAENWRFVEGGVGERCAIDDAGQMSCWGRAFRGGLASGLWYDDRLFAEMRRIGAFDEVSFGFGTMANVEETPFGCARHGTVVSCWGANVNGELGIGAPTRHYLPVRIPAPSGTWTAIRGGQSHVCATTTTNVYCWGADSNSQVAASIARGDMNPCIANEPCDYPVPTEAPGDITAADELAIGDQYSCARVGTSIKCWGSGAVGANLDRGFASVQPPPGGTWARLTGGLVGNCGITTANAVACWGNVAGTNQGRPTLPMSAEVHDIDAASFGYNFTCMHRSTDNARVCWGDNNNGQLGDGTTTNASATGPRVLGAHDTKVVAVGRSHGCAINAAGGVICWGPNDYGQVGAPADQVAHPMPVTVSSMTGPLTGCTKLAIGEEHSCALCGGRVSCWGRNESGALGRVPVMPAIPNYLATPITLDNEVFVDITARGFGNCGLTDDGDLYCWGGGGHGDNGDGGGDRNLPTPVVAAGP